LDQANRREIRMPNPSDQLQLELFHQEVRYDATDETNRGETTHKKSARGIHTSVNLDKWTSLHESTFRSMVLIVPTLPPQFCGTRIG